MRFGETNRQTESQRENVCNEGKVPGKGSPWIGRLHQPVPPGASWGLCGVRTTGGANTARKGKARWNLLKRLGSSDRR